MLQFGGFLVMLVGVLAAALLALAAAVCVGVSSLLAPLHWAVTAFGGGAGGLGLGLAAVATLLVLVAGPVMLGLLALARVVRGAGRRV